MTEFIIEDIDTQHVEPDAQVAEPVAEAPEPPPLERLPTVAFSTSQGEEVSFAAAPKKRGRPKGKAKPKVRPSAPVEEYVEPEAPTPPPIDVNALMEPIFKAYMQTHELRKRQQRNTRYHDLFSGMTGY